MSDKSKNSVVKLIGNKLFILLLVFAIAIILISAAFNRSIQKVAQEYPEYTIDLPVVTEVEAPKLENVSPVIEDIGELVEEFKEEEEEVVETVAEIKYRLPLAGELQKEFSSDELLWDETMKDWRTHNGVDIAADKGTEVVTAARGTVSEAFEDEMYGFTVKIQHPDGVVTVYKNLEKILVKKEDILDEGQMIGTVGNTGTFEMSQSPHLHFEVISENKNINPLEFIK